MRWLAGVAMTLLAAAPAMAGESGQAIFQARCASCHSAIKGGPSVSGPPLYGVAGRKAASAPGGRYSPALTASGMVWNDVNLKAYLTAPAKTVPGTSMAFFGLKDPAQVDAVVGYLKTLR